jgi:hypothetical protein
MKKALKSFDLFGHAINLNFDGERGSYPTSVCGCTSLTVKTLILVYVIVLVKKMIFYEDDKLNSVSSIRDLSEIDAVALSETRALPYLQVTHYKLGWLKMDDPEVKKYIKVKGYKIEADFTKSTELKFSEVKVRPCELRDFS